MSIKYALLGYLQWQPQTGYDLKKIIANSEMLHWSANNNQIYRALVQLHDAGLIDKQVETQEGSPNRHVYQITEAGQAALKEWITTAVSPAPETNNPFFTQLMWADCLDANALDALLENYLNAVGEKLFMLRVQADRKPDYPDRTSREALLWTMMARNWIAHYELELRWIRQLREELQELETARQREEARQQRQRNP